MQTNTPLLSPNGAHDPTDLLGRNKFMKDASRLVPPFRVNTRHFGGSQEYEIVPYIQSVAPMYPQDPQAIPQKQSRFHKRWDMLERVGGVLMMQTLSRPYELLGSQQGASLA